MAVHRWHYNAAASGPADWRLFDDEANDTLEEKYNTYCESSNRTYINNVSIKSGGRRVSGRAVVSLAGAPPQSDVFCSLVERSAKL